MAGLCSRLLRPWRRPPPFRPSIAEPLDHTDLDSLEIVEVDAEGRLTAAPERRAELHEVGYAPRHRDATGVAGLWEALGSS